MTQKDEILNVCFFLYDLCRNPWSELYKTIILVFVKMKDNSITIYE